MKKYYTREILVGMHGNITKKVAEEIIADIQKEHPNATLKEVKIVPAEVEKAFPFVKAIYIVIMEENVN